MNQNTKTSESSEPIGKVLSLDMGIGSIGLALQLRTRLGESVDYSFPLVRSCTLPEDWASLAPERTRRRMYRTREAHKAREHWLRHVFEECGLGDAVLRGRKTAKKKIALPDGPNKTQFSLVRKGDYRLEREFPPKLGQKPHDEAPNDQAGSRTVYCGAALRCLLLLGAKAQIAAQGRSLESWQVFKALHSAIQKRGFDPDVPWKRSSNHDGGGKSAKEQEERDTLARANAMEAIIEAMFPSDETFQHPCFWEACQMGLWSPQEPHSISSSYTHHAKSTKWADRFDPARQSDPVAKSMPAIHKTPAVFPRRLVERELLALCEAAERILPQLAGKSLFIAYGPTEIAYPTISRQGSHKREEEEKRRAAVKAVLDQTGKRIVRGKAAEWDAALGQKAPTFDNRCVGSCVLIPRFNTVKSECRYRDQKLVTDSLLASEISFLLQLKHFSFAPCLSDGRECLNAEDIRVLYKEKFESTVLKRLASSSKYALTHSELTKWLSKRFGGAYGPKPGHSDGAEDAGIDKPKQSGRSRFCKPALRLLKALLLSGLAPAEFKRRLINLNQGVGDVVPDVESLGTWESLRRDLHLTAPDGTFNEEMKKGVVLSDLDFLDRIGASWEKLSVRDERLASFSEIAVSRDVQARKEAIANLIGSEINPKIRHRLTMLNQILDEHFPTPDTFPDRVVLEFARDEFMGQDSERRKKLLAFQRERRDERLAILEKVGAGASEDAILKRQLYDEQNGLCLFCGDTFSDPRAFHTSPAVKSYADAEICHLVSKKAGGPRAYINLVLGCKACNATQRDRYHAVAFAEGKFPEGKSPRGWDSFVQFIGEQCPRIRPFKKKLLTTASETEAAEMVQNRTALQETAWISKLARTLICLKFGWPLDFEGMEKKIVVVTGSITNRVARRYRLYRLLGEPGRVEALEKEFAAAIDAIAILESGGATPDEVKKARAAAAKKQKEIDDKCRGDRRHHALDAMILSFLPHWAGDPTKNVFFGLPDKGRDWSRFFRDILDRVVPEELRFEKPVLRETIYGMRPSGTGAPQAAIRRVVLEMGFETADANGNPIKFGVPELKKKVSTIRNAAIRAKLAAFADDLEGIEELAAQRDAWIEFCQTFRLKPGGPLIHRVSCWSDKLEIVNYENLAKDRNPDGDRKHRGQWRCGKGAHQGQWLYLDHKGDPRICAVKVFESKSAVRDRLEAGDDCQKIVAFLQSGCVVQIDSTVVSGAKTVPPGKYRSGGVEEKARKIDLKNARGTEFKKIPLTSLIKAGFRRIG